LNCRKKPTTCKRDREEYRSSLQSNAVTFPNFLQFSCGIIRDLFCMLSAFLLQFHCGIFPRTIENIVAIIMHLICGCFRDFCEEAAETRAEYMQNKSLQCFLNFAEKIPQFTAAKMPTNCKRYREPRRNCTAENGERLPHFLEFNCGVVRDLFCRFSAFFCCSRFRLHVMCACFRDFCKEVAKHPQI
jgi:hypothetical protein